MLQYAKIAKYDRIVDQFSQIPGILPITQQNHELLIFFTNLAQWNQNQNRSNPSRKGNVLDPKYLASTSCIQKICPSEPSESEMHEIAITQALNGTQLYTKLSSHETYVHRQICLVQQCLRSNPLSPCWGQRLRESLKNVPH